MQMLSTGVSCILKVPNKTNVFHLRTNDRTNLILLLTYRFCLTLLKSQISAIKMFDFLVSLFCREVFFLYVDPSGEFKVDQA